MYDIPEFNFNKFKKSIFEILSHKFMPIIILVVVVAVAIFLQQEKVFKNKNNNLFLNIENSVLQPLSQKSAEKYVSKIEYEQAIIDSVASASPSVVSIVISKNVPVYEQQFINPFGSIPGFNSPFDFQIPQNVQKGTKYQEVGAGSGFIVSEDGLVLTNKHVVSDKIADYTVFTNDGKKYKAKVLARDPVLDLAIIKIQDTGNFPSIKLGNSDGIQIGQGAIAIGNALGEFRNTVSVGIISGLGRTISASGGGGFSEVLEDVIQTDAAINQGNSGGPLLNLRGEVIGINTATAQGAQTIGFTIPINVAKRDIDQIIEKSRSQSDRGSSTESGQIKIQYPFLGVRYVVIDDIVKQKYNLSVDYGALVLKGDNGEAAVTKDSSADKAGIKEKDIILEINGKKITKDNSLAKIIRDYNPNDKVTLKVLRPANNASGIVDADGDWKEINVDVILGERS